MQLHVDALITVICTIELQGKEMGTFSFLTPLSAFCVFFPIFSSHFHLLHLTPQLHLPSFAIAACHKVSWVSCALTGPPPHHHPFPNPLTRLVYCREKA